MNFTDKFLQALEDCKSNRLTTFSHIATLVILSRAKNGVYMSFLANQLKVSTASVTAIADKLSDMKLAKRVPDAEDRRSYRLQITAAGRDAIDIILPNQ